jgi:hypothetical protein
MKNKANPAPQYNSASETADSQLKDFPLSVSDFNVHIELHKSDYAEEPLLQLNSIFKSQQQKPDKAAEPKVFLSSVDSYQALIGEKAILQAMLGE